ncbi:MAG: RimK-like ATPgrasp N-terminal domain-containing protein, partial [Marinobacter sp.]|nr:RimK-like ATPgrasp N-terminal domain-containing protein [Marinobacter sp.]
MSRLLIVVDRATDWAPYYPSEDVLTFEQYLHFSASGTSRVRVINLCQSARYLSQGYYCSLLAEARGHNVVPSVMTLNDLSRKGLFSLELTELDPSVIQWLEEAGSRVRPGHDDSGATHEVRVRTYFGQVQHPELKPVARALFE